MGMVYLKSTVAGVAALLVIAFVIAIAALLAIAVRRSGDLVIWHVHTESGVFWLLAIVIFALGFIWKFKRLSN
jgi:H+/Cl- antiporter ClcA